MDFPDFTHRHPISYIVTYWVSMGKVKRYTQKFKIEAVKQTNERGYSVAEVS